MQKLLFWLRWLTAAACVILLMLLAWQCIDIYSDGLLTANTKEDEIAILSIFRMEDVANRLNALTIPLILCASFTLVTTIVHLYSHEKSNNRIIIFPDNQLRLIKTNVSVLPAAAVAEERRRRRIKIVSCAVIVGCSLISSAYFLQEKHFTSWDLETVMCSMIFHVSPWILIAFVSAMIATVLCESSYLREIMILNQFAHNKRADNAPSVKETSMTFVLRIALYAAAILFIVLGVMNGGLYDVLVKAINICTECIGLG